MARNMFEIQALSYSATSELLSKVEENLGRYRQENSWAISSLAGMQNAVISTRLKPAVKLVLESPQQKDMYDLENSIRMHRALPNLTPVQARDPRLWTYLAHVTFWEYMRKRWPAEGKSDAQKAANYVRERYFVAQQASRSLSRHGIARLWWYGHLTHDETRTNPYELTNVLLKKLDITQTVLERSLGRNRLVRITLLEYLLQHKQVFLREGDKGRLAVRYLAKALNLHGGGCLLDAMSRDGLRRFFDRQLPRIEKEFA